MSKYWSDDEFIEIVRGARSIKEVLIHFGLSNQGRYNREFHKSAQALGIDISHFRMRKRGNSKTPLKVLLVKGDVYHSSSSLRKRLISEGLLTNECNTCGLSPSWCSKSLTLQLDHVNGDNTDNRIENLRLLCPNCHSQTETFCGNKRFKIRRVYVTVCSLCGGAKAANQSKICKSCNIQRTKSQSKIEWPEPQAVLRMVKETSFLAVGKKLGVSDNAVRKFLRRNKIEW